MAVGKITSRAIESGAITADQIATGAITSADISDGEITAAKLHTTLDFSTKTFTMHNNHITETMVTQHSAPIIAQITDSAPATLDTLNELAAALGDDPNFATTITNSIATKLSLSGGTLTGDIAHAGDLTLDVGGTIILDADGADVILKDGGTEYGRLTQLLGNLAIKSGPSSAAAFVIDGSGNVIGGGDYSTSGAGSFGGLSVTGTTTLSGDVGIGTSPDTKLHVYNASGNTYAKLESNANNTRSALLPWAKKSDGSTLRGYIGVTGDANKMEVATSTNDSIHFYTNNNPTNNGIFLKNNGYVGIGKTNPSEMLHIEATDPKIRLLNNSTGRAGLEWWNDYGGSDHINSSIEWNEGSANWEFKSYRADGQSGSPYGNIDFFNGSETSPTLTLRIATNNNVAIGHSSPTDKLDVKGADNGITIRSETANRPKLSLINGSSTMLTLSANGTYAAIGDGADANRYMSFRGGKVGVGDTDPDTSLHVAGNVKVGSAASSSWATSIQDAGGLDIVTGSGSHLIQAWDDNYQSRPRFEVARDGHIWAGQNLQFHENNTSTTQPFNITNSSSTQNFFVPNTYGSGNVNETYRHCYNINCSSHWVLFEGGGGNTVFTTYAFIGGDHYKDITVWSITQYYSDLKIKVIQNTGNAKSIWVAGNTYNNNVYTLNWRVMPVRPCTIDHNPSSSQSDGYMIHHASGGEQFSATSTFTSGTGPSTY